MEWDHQPDRLYNLATDADVLVVAGDLVTDTFLKHDLKILCDLYPHVVYVTGNHEYYGSVFERIHQKLGDFSAKTKNFHWLNNSHVKIDGQRFIGGTLWFELSCVSKQKWLQRQLNDFRMIGRFDPFTNFNKTVRFLKKNVKETDIVVTHHMPHPKGNVGYEDSILSCFFFTDLTEFINEAKPKLWLFGHAHESSDFIEGSTRLVCNPYGYVGYATNRNFKNDLIIEV